MTININNSPGTVVNVVNGDQVTTSRDVFDAAVSIHPFLDKIAKLVKTRKADRVVMRANRPDLQQQVQFDRTNQDSFQLPSANIIEEDPVEFECNIYRFNKKSLKGVLEFYDEDEVQIRPFMTGRDLLDDCMEAFKAPRANFIAHKEVTTNALGETKIKKFHLVAITPTGESDE